MKRSGINQALKELEAMCEKYHCYLPPLCHFTLEPGTGPVLLGEVSQCNDDNTDNRFHLPVGRFPEIGENKPPCRLLCNEYPEVKV